MLAEVDSLPSALTRTEIGLHQFVVEPDEVVLLIVKGNVTASEAAEIQTKLVEYGAIHSSFTLVVDVAEMTSMESGARQRFVRVERQYPLRRLVLVGASFPIRILTTGIYRAGRTLRPHAFGWQMDAVKSLDEARRLIQMR